MSATRTLPAVTVAGLSSTWPDGSVAFRFAPGRTGLVGWSAGRLVAHPDAVTSRLALLHRNRPLRTGDTGGGSVHDRR